MSCELLVLTAVLLKIQVFCIGTVFSLVNSSLRFDGSQRLHLQWETVRALDLF
jgi:hypothetical protein